ncbi:MAG TPA: hypothetical protein VFO06_08205 [Gemmatimonadales bacterium]|nr:hypothetical protein [Gemmatimonadales bacterium]
MRPPLYRFAALAAFAALALAACGDDSNSPNDPITADDAQNIGETSAALADLAVAGLQSASLDVSNGPPGSLFAAARITPPGIRLGASMLALGRSVPDGCPDITGLTDSDGDGIPDHAVFTFTAADCTTIYLDGAKEVVTGVIRLSDPGATPGYDLVYDDWRVRYYDPGETSPALNVLVNGHWLLQGTTTSRTLSQQTDINLAANGQSATLTSDFDAGFTATVPGTLAWNQPLPDGSIQFNGDWTIDSPSGDFALGVETLAPLHFDPACLGITGGELMAVGSNGGSVDVTWSGCGVYTAEFVEGN